MTDHVVESLRDTSFNGITVCLEYVQKEEVTSKFALMRFLDERLRNGLVATIKINTHFLRDEVNART